MGTCINSANQVILPDIQDLFYNYNVILKIQLYENNQKVDQDIVKVTCKSPIEVQAFNYQIHDSSYFISTCVLPGLDPRGQFNKECQDGSYFVKKTFQDKEVLICCLFDGHGREGDRVVDFCKKFQIEFIEQNLEMFANQAAKAIGQALQKSDQEIKKIGNDIDVSNSGTTAIMVVISQDIIAVGSLGDSRCIISQISEKSVEIKQSLPCTNDRYNRAIIPITPLDAIQLTYDQKPEIPEEFNRIIQNGGRVQQLVDEFGNKVGPFRV